MTDMVVLNMELWSVAMGLVAFTVPTAVFAAFMLGRWAAWRWFERNGAAMAEEATVARAEAAERRVAEAESELGVERRERTRVEEQVRGLTAAIRGAHSVLDQCRS